MPSLALIQLASIGDLVSLLPVCKHYADEGYEVSVLTMPEYAPVLEAASYVKPVICTAKNEQLYLAEKQAEAMGFDRVIVTQRYQNQRRAPFGVTNYQCQQWAYAEILERFHELPTIFDRRDRKGEADAIQRYIPPDDGRPLLITNFAGKTSPYWHAEEQSAWVAQAFPDYRVLDLTNIRLPKVHHLLGLLERADVLVTIDTSLLHLAHATMTPTIALQPENRYARSEPRRHWIYACTYAESVSDEHRSNIRWMLTKRDWELGKLCRPASAMRQDIIWHLVDYGYDIANPRLLEARYTWEHLREADCNYRIVFHQAPPVQSFAPVLAKAFERDVRDCDILIFADRMTKLPTDAPVRLRDGETIPGVFAARVGWWRDNAERLGAMSLSESLEMSEFCPVSRDEITADLVH